MTAYQPLGPKVYTVTKVFTNGWGVDRPWDERCVPNLRRGMYYLQVPTIAEYRKSVEMLVARDQGIKWETGRGYLKVQS